MWLIFEHVDSLLTLGYSFNELFGGGQAVDRVRGQNVPKVGPTLDYLGALIYGSSSNN